MSGSIQKLNPGFRCIVNRHPIQVKCFDKSRLLDGYKPVGVDIKIDGSNIVIVGETERSMKDVKKKIEKRCGQIVNDVFEVDSALGQLLTKEQVRQYIDDRLGTAMKPFAWGVEVIMEVDNLMVSALTKADVSKVKMQILACVTETPITMDVSGTVWFETFLERESGKVSVKKNNREAFTVYTTLDLYEKYLKPNLVTSPDPKASVGSGRKSKSPAPQPQTPGTNDKKNSKTMPTATTSKTKKKGNSDEKPNKNGKTKGKQGDKHSESVSIVPSSQSNNIPQDCRGTNGSDGYKPEDAEPEPDYNLATTVKEITSTINIGNMTWCYVEKHLSKNIADFSNQWDVKFQKTNNGLSLKGKQANVDSAKKNVCTLLDSLNTFSKQEVFAGKPCAPDNMIEGWQQLEAKESCMINVEGFKRPILKSGWIHDKDDQTINLLFVEGKMDFCTVDVALCAVNSKLKPMGAAMSLLGPDQHSFSGDGKEKHTAGDILHFKNPENVYCHHMVLHVVKRKPLEVTESQIKDLAEHIITTLEKDGFKSFGLYLQYSEDHFWHDYSCKLVEGLLHVSSSKKLKCPVTVYCFGNKDSFEDLDEFLDNQLNLARDLKPVVIETTSHQGCKKSPLKMLFEEGSILDYDKVDIIVNSVRSSLDLNHGIVSKLLLKKGGQDIQQECRKSYGEGINLGEVAVTSAGQLNFKKIFHVALYTEWNPEGKISAMILKTIVIRCLEEAEKRKLSSISFPSLGTGTLGYPPLLVAKTMEEAVNEFGKTQPKYLQTVVFVLFDGKQSVQLFKDVDNWLRSRNRAKIGWDLPPKHVMYTDLECRVIVSDRDYYSGMAYKELRVVVGSSSGKGMNLVWDANDGCFVTTISAAIKEEGTKAMMMDLITLMQGNKLHIMDLFLDASRFPAQRQIEILIQEIYEHESTLNSRNGKLQKNQRPEINYVKYIRIFLHTQEYSNVADYYSGSVLAKENTTNWHITDIKSYPYTVEVVGMNGKVEKVFQKVCNDVSSLQPTMKSTWQIRESEVKKAKKTMEKFKSRNFHIVFEDDSHCVICDGTQKQLDEVSKALEKIIDLNLYFNITEDDFSVLLHFTNEDNWRANVLKPRYEKGRAIFTLDGSTDIHDIRTVIESKLNVIHHLPSIEIYPPSAFEHQFEAVQDRVNNLDEGILCIMGIDRNKILMKSENYQLLQQAKYVVEVELGMIQTTGRRNRVIATNEYSRDPAKNQSTNPDSSVKQGKCFKTNEGIHVLVYSAGIGNLNVDTLVNAANKDLQHGGGIAYHISDSAGYELNKECDDYINHHGSLRVGTCVSTTAGKLPYRCIVHAVGPMWHSYPNGKKQQCLDDLKQTVMSAITEAASQSLNSIAIPSISSGIFGVPKELCTDQYYKAVVEYSHRNPQTSIKEIHFIDKDKAMCALIQKTFEKEFGYSGKPL